MTVRRSTLRIFKGSVFDRQFDDAVWLTKHTGKAPINEWGNEQVVEWAKYHAEVYGAIAELFEKNGIIGSGLLALDSEDLKELKTNRSGSQELVTKAITDLQMNQYSELFIDHNEYCFRKIIDQLRLKASSNKRYRPLFLSDINEREQERFAETLDYYFPGELAQLIWKKPTLVSRILSDDQVDNITKWLVEGKCGFDAKLLYRASRDGWQASNFHAKCDNQGPTLTVIRTTGGYIFGGYCDTPWSSASGY
eukprot:13327643-Ditylum_brightwellii.AAC.1